MATIKAEWGRVDGAEVLVSWVNCFSKEHQIRCLGDIRYWVKLAQERNRERHSYILLRGDQAKDGKLHSLSFRVGEGGITFLASNAAKQKKKK